MTTRDLWRGIRRNAYPVTQMDGVLGVALGAVSLSGGVWASVEMGDTRHELRPDLRADDRAPSQWTVWGQVAARRARLAVAAGILQDSYVRTRPDPTVTELYATARLDAGRWMPSFSLWHAVDGADGDYLEPAIAFHHVVNPFAGPAAAWTSTLRAGIQVGHREPDGGAAVPGPTGVGLTHIALSTTFRLTASLRHDFGFALSFGPEVQVNRDPATKAHRDGSDAGDVRVWLPVQIGISWPFRRPQ